MGAKSTKTDQQVEQTNINHSNFVTACIVGEGEQKCIQTAMSLDEGVCSKWKNDLNNAGFNQEHLMLPTNNEYTSKGLCGNSGILKLRFPNYPYLLNEEIEKRSENHQWFEESDLWFLLNCLLSAQQEVFTKTHTKIGDVRPSNVFISENGEIKVSTLLSWPGETTNCAKSFEGQKTYISPEEAKRLSLGETEKPSDTSSELFSIGLTILSSALLTDCSVLYGTNGIDWGHFEGLMSQLKICTRYSEIFRSLITNLCSSQVEKRLTSTEIWTWIHTYVTPIENKENFIITSVPSKLEKEVNNLKLFLCKWGKPVQQPVSIQIPANLHVPFGKSVAYNADMMPTLQSHNLLCEPVRFQHKLPLQFIGNNTHQPIQSEVKTPLIPTLHQVHLEGTTQNWENQRASNAQQKSRTNL